jgi:predicted permease
VSSSRVEAELDEEMRYHLDRQIDVFRAQGMSRAEARFRALREFGGVDQRKEECRDARGLRLIESCVQDVRYALRALRRTPGFTAVALLSLTLGIGANTTIFTFVNAVLLRPLPFPHADRLVTVREQPLASDETVAVHPQNFLAWRARVRSFEAIAIAQRPPVNVLGRDGAEQVSGANVTPDLFRVFGLPPVAGREFTAADAMPGSEPVAILGYGFWQRRFGGRRTVVGQRLMVSDGSRTIVGIASPELKLGLTEPDVYTPLAIDPSNPGAVGSRSFECYARLRPGVALTEARAELDAVARQLARELPLDRGYGVFVTGLQDYLVREGRRALRLLMTVVAVVLLLACVNVAGLLTVRGAARRQELAVRASLGASKGRLVRQLVIESLVLATIAAVTGLVLARWSTRALVALTEGALSFGTTRPVELDATCLAFTLAISTLTALAFGLIPASQAGNAEPQAALGRHSRGGTADRVQHHLRSALVVAEVALAVVLMVGAGLLLRTLTGLVSVDLGFRPAETITMRLFLGDRDAEYRVRLMDEILRRVDAVPGVKAAGTIQFLPLAGMTCGTGVWLADQPTSDPGGLTTECSLVSRGYFAAMGVPVLQGRAFDARDTASATRVAIVNRAFVRRYFPDGRALGRPIRVHATDRPPSEIVGVVGDIRHGGLTTDPAPTVFLLHAQNPGYVTSLVVRTTGDPTAFIGSIKAAIRDADRTQAVSDVKTMDQYVADLLARPRLYAVMVASFALLALVVAAVGVYGLIAYVAAQRTHEFGIRMALGAAPGAVFRSVFGQGTFLTVTGLLVGLALSLALQRVIATLLFGVTATDPATYVTAAAVFAGLALVATVGPAWRASRVDPTTALRYD